MWSTPCQTESTQKTMAICHIQELTMNHLCYKPTIAMKSLSIQTKSVKLDRFRAMTPPTMSWTFQIKAMTSRMILPSEHRQSLTSKVTIRIHQAWAKPPMPWCNRLPNFLPRIQREKPRFGADRPAKTFSSSQSTRMSMKPWSKNLQITKND